MSLRSNVTMLHGTSKCRHRLELSFQEELTVKKGDVLGFYGVLGFAIVSFYCIQQVGNGGASWVALVVKHRWHFEFPSLIKNQWYARLKHKGRHCHVLFWLLGMVIDNECWQVDSFVFYLLGWLKHLCWLSSGCVTTSCKVTQGEMNTKKVTRFKLHHFQIFVASKPNDSKDSKIPTSQHQIWQKQIVELRSRVWRLLAGTGSLFITVLLFMAMKKWGIQLSTFETAEIRWKKTFFSRKFLGSSMF